MLAQHLIKVVLGIPDWTANSAIVVAPFAGLAFAAEEDAHQPPVPPTTDDLSGFSRQNHILPLKIWHTTGTPALEVTLSIQGLGGKEE
jgi:hypothetical protein